MFESGNAVAIGAIVVAIAAVAWYAASRLVIVPPNKAIIRSGLGKENGIYLKGLVLFLPILHKKYELELGQRTVKLEMEGPDSNFVPTKVIANMTFKFSDTAEGVGKAIQRFGDHSPALINASVIESAEGILRSIVSAMTVEEANNDLKKFRDQALAIAETQFAEQGIQIDLFNISAVATPDQEIMGTDGKSTIIVNYLKEAGRPQLEQVLQAANIAASAAKQKSEAARLAQEAVTAGQERDLAIKQAGFKAEKDTQDAVANAATQLETAKQGVLIAKLEREEANEKALVAEAQLEIDVNKPADAAAYAKRIAAEADLYEGEQKAKTAKITTVLEAEGVAEGTKLQAVADAEKVRLAGAAEGESIAAVGAAQAGADEARAKALTLHNAESLSFLAVQALPAIVQSSASAVAGIDNYTVISTDGASDAVKQGTKIVTEALGTLRGGSGIDLGAVFAGLASSLVPTTPAHPAPVPAFVTDPAVLDIGPEHWESGK